MAVICFLILRLKKSWVCFSAALVWISVSQLHLREEPEPSAPYCTWCSSSYSKLLSSGGTDAAPSTTRALGCREGLPGAVSVKRTAKTGAFCEVSSLFNFPDALLVWETPFLHNCLSYQQLPPLLVSSLANVLINLFFFFSADNQDRLRELLNVYSLIWKLLIITFTASRE